MLVWLHHHYLISEMFSWSMADSCR